MSRNLTSGMFSAVQASPAIPILIASIETASGFVRAWSGIGDLVFNGDTYDGVGNLGGIDQIKETSSMEAAGLNFQLSGIPSSLIASALGQIRYGRAAKLWLGALDSSGNLVANPYLVFGGLTDNAVINEGPETSTISIAAESRFIDLDRARARRYTSEDQNLSSPGDLGFDFVPKLQDAVIMFGAPGTGGA